MASKSTLVFHRTIVLILSVALPFIAHAFGPPGHRAIGVMAWDQLEPEVQQQIEGLLGGGRETFAVGCEWPDQVLSLPEYQYSRPLHYVNIPQGKRYDADRDCPDGECLVSAIQRFSIRMVDEDLGPDQRVEAINFLCHFVGDLHQPLHVGYAEDRGGNDYQVSLGANEQVNLHALWDHVLPSYLVGMEWIDESVLTACGADETPWSASELLVWTQGSRVILERHGLVYPQNAKFGPDYHGEGKALLRIQLCRAANRLARILNSQF